ncbi:MAG: acetyl-CoA carboxylase biotin carboxyl carrier protein subunit [Firmicutes bacterium]|nr:acetyl-CoA carboxylase biotin carboxyl carrier protein subunit [Bacillota bacterium]
MRTFTVKVNGTAYEVEVEEAAAGGAPAVQSVAPAAVAPASAPAPAAAKTAPAAGGTQVKAQMPGLVLNIVVAEGATVKQNDKIMVIEAMKMATDIFANASGVISFAVRKGDNFNTGAVLATIQ